MWTFEKFLSEQYYGTKVSLGVHRWALTCTWFIIHKKVWKVPVRRGDAKAWDVGEFSEDGEGFVVGVSGELSAASDGFDAAPDGAYDLTALLVLTTADHYQFSNL